MLGSWDAKGHAPSKGALSAQARPTPLFRPGEQPTGGQQGQTQMFWPEPIIGAPDCIIYNIREAGRVAR